MTAEEEKVVIEYIPVDSEKLRICYQVIGYPEFPH